MSNNKVTSTKKFFTSLLAIGLLSTVAIQASAAPPEAATPNSGSGIYLDTERNWYYGCYPERNTAIEAFPPPNILIMLDTSGSMNDRDSGPQGRTKRITRAKDALLELLKANSLASQPMAYFGFGNYPNYWGSYSSARINNECAPQNDAAIWDFARTIPPRGSTPTDAAVELASESSCHHALRPNQSSATAVITDGAPNSRENAIRKTCEHRKIAPLFSIGLGSGTDVVFNNLMAAAGGTGSCTDSSGHNWDPCDHLRDLDRQSFRPPSLGVSCEGSLSATNTNELVNALKNIVAKVSCNFPLDTVGIDSSRIPNDPENKYPWIKVKLQQPGGSGDRTVTNENDTSTSQATQNRNDGWTWKFANSEKNAVSLGAGACSAIKQQQVSSVKTQVGCICLQPPGSQCEEQRRNGRQVCPPGRFACNLGLDKCEGAGQNNKTDILCRTTQLGICKVGHFECVDGKVACLPNNRPMPELCDGLDNDCDGRDDDIMTSWRNPKFQTELQKLEENDKKVYNQYHIQACFAQNRCVCPTLIPPEVEVPMSSEDLSKQYSSYATYSDKQRGTCHCQAF